MNEHMSRPVAAGRAGVAGLLGATVVSGLLFTPVFGLAALVIPLLVVALLGYGCYELCARRTALVPWRPILVLVTGLLGLIESVLFATTTGGLPTAATMGSLGRGLTRGWLLTLQSTLPARPDAEQVLFVPLAVLLAVALGLEILLRLRKPLPALLPSLAVAGLAQAYQALTGLTAMLAALAYLAPAGLLLWAGRAARPTTRSTRSTRPGAVRPPSWAGVVLALPTVIGVLAGAVALGGLDPASREPYRLADGHPAPPPPGGLTNPLDEIASRLADPGQEVFRYRSDADVGRWRLVVLDDFDGATWSADTRLQRMGTRLAAVPGSTVDSAEVRLRDSSGPWLPSQPNPVSVDGAAPLVDQSAGTLLSTAGGGETRYTLTWSAPEAEAGRLGAAEVDTRLAGGLGGLGAVPDEISQLAHDAVRGLRPTFQTALQLERFLGENYRVAVGDTLPTGNGWPQLRRFLTETKRGTSEQFAAAYVVLARIAGIPARLVVGYQGSTETEGGFHVVRNRDVLAWPEVAVAGVGWVPLDPTATAGRAERPQSGLDKAATQARHQLPPENQLLPPQLPPGQQEEAGDASNGGGSHPWWAMTAAVPAALVCWLGGVPLAKAVRARRRRRRHGADGVLGAWAEARDRLCAHNVPYRIGMTPRDLAESAGSVLGERAREPMARLAGVLDIALWSGAAVSDGAVAGAWTEVRELRRGLATRPVPARLRAALEPRTLLPRPGRPTSP
ncbi:transglutaminaseTgpA domain-containing protein [Amycolatopsis cynarae]|uniref:TransglutaminaseTgpA domain-containing protein n=1 Tax=Amycolatopsis cynarae TaxID=2995223 RepID=A0ABY7BA59_9PSEU|nr:transglutaminase domain-containing protein [Amycolatopsis sp. HUAS 11-8]WAL68107.1 transglutaminaseTgpA domain-containing protein [Amycolatopsis sp. HUAS 11-8]